MAETGDRVELAEWTIQVTGTDRNAITEISLQSTANVPG
jgi:hypothetical protein